MTLESWLAEIAAEYGAWHKKLQSKGWVEA